MNASSRKKTVAAFAILGIAGMLLIATGAGAFGSIGQASLIPDGEGTYAKRFYEVTDHNTNFDMWANSYYLGWGESLNWQSALIGKEVNQVTVPMQKSGSPNGKIDVGIWTKDGSKVFHFGTIPSSSITTTEEFYTFRNPDATRILKEGDKIGVRLIEATTGTQDRVRAFGLNTDPFDTFHSQRVRWNGTGWNYAKTTDMTMVIGYVNPIAQTGDTTPPVLEVTKPARQATVKSPIAVAGTASDIGGSGVKIVEVRTFYQNVSAPWKAVTPKAPNDWSTWSGTVTTTGPIDKLTFRAVDNKDNAVYKGIPVIYEGSPPPPPECQTPKVLENGVCVDPDEEPTDTVSFLDLLVTSPMVMGGTAATAMAGVGGVAAMRKP